MTTVQMFIEKGKIEGKAEGRAEGKAEGKLETSNQIAKALKLKGMPLEQISEVTGFSISELKKL